MLNQINEKLDNIQKIMDEQLKQQKRFMNLNQAADYLDLSPSYLYKLVSKGAIHAHKPNGKKIYFSREELDKWVMDAVEKFAQSSKSSQKSVKGANYE